MEKEILALTKKYFELVDEDISVDFQMQLINAVIDKYKNLRNYPDWYTDDMIDADVERYFERRKTDIAFEIIPELYGRIGAEGLSMLTDAGSTRMWVHKVILDDVTPICEVV